MLEKEKTLINKYSPHPELKNYIQCYWTLKCFDTDSLKKFYLVSLDAGLDIVFNLSNPVGCGVDYSTPVMIDKDFIIGSLARSLHIEPSGGISLFGVRFTPEGLYPYFSMPPADISDFCVEIEEIWELNGLGLAKLIHNTNPVPESLIQTFEDFFLNRMKKFRKHSLNVEKAVAMIRSHKGRISVEALANSLKISIRHLERKFIKRIGIPPKQLCRIFRIKNVLIDSKISRYDSASLAIESGYFDQSHFIREFKYFTGYSPMTYLKREYLLENQ